MHRTVVVLLLAALLGAPVLGQEEAEPRITIIAPEEDLRTVLDSISDQTGYGVSIPSEIRKTVTLRLKDVTVAQALDAILAPNGLHYLVEDKIITVYTTEMAKSNPRLRPPLEHRVFRLKHVPYSAVEKAVKTLLGPEGKVEAVAPPLEEAEEIGGPVGAPRMVTAEPAETEIIQTDPRRAYSFLVTDTRAAIEAIAGVLEDLDGVKRQVYLSVVIFEMTKSQQEQIGFRWQISNAVNGSGLPWNFPFGSQDLGEYSPRIAATEEFAPSDSGLFPTLPGDSNAGGSADAPFLFGAIDLTGTQLLMELNRLGALIDIVSQQRLMVANNEEGVVLVGERFPIFTSRVTDQGTATESFDRYENIGIQMTVVPHILESGAVDLDLHPQITALGPLVTGSTGLTAPRINTREVVTRFTVNNGQSVVIAGLKTERTVENTSSVPFLGNIPWIGALFRYRDTTVEEVELAVVATPYVDGIGAEHDTERELDRSGARPMREPEPGEPE